MLTTLLDTAAGWPLPAVLIVGALLLVVESGTLVGVLLPGTSVVVALGLWSEAVGMPLAVVSAVAATATVAGAHLSWWQGRLRATRASLSAPPAASGRHLRIAAAMRRFGHQGPAATTAVLAAGHWASAARAILPRIAGQSGVPYRLAVPALTLSGTAWATTLLLVGREAGPYVVTRAGWVLLVLVLVLAGVVAARSRRTVPARAPTAPTPDVGAAGGPAEAFHVVHTA